MFSTALNSRFKIVLQVRRHHASALVRKLLVPLKQEVEVLSIKARGIFASPQIMTLILLGKFNVELFLIGYRSSLETLFSKW